MQKVAEGRPFHFGKRIAEDLFPGGVELAETAVKIGDAQQIGGDRKEILKDLRGLEQPRRRRCSSLPPPADDKEAGTAEGDKQQVIKASEARKQQQINEAEGQAAAILAVAGATQAR